MRRLALHGLFLAAVLGVWQWAAGMGAINVELIPAPSDIARALVVLAGREDVRQSAYVTFLSAAVAFGISVPLGLVVGAWLARSARFGPLLTPLVNFIFGVPKSIFLPVFILVFGISMGQKVAFAVFSTTFIIVVAAMGAVRAIPAELALIGRAYGASPAQVLRFIFLPAIAPVLIEAMRLAFIFNLTSIVLAEMYAAKDGLGTRVTSWGEAQNMPPLFACLVALALFSILVNECLALLERRVGTWRSDDRSPS